MRRWPAAAALLLLAGCGADGGQVCPAIGWSNTLTVALAADWPPGEGRSVRVECSSPCGWQVRRDADPVEVTEVSAPLSGPGAVVPFAMTSPDSVVVTVLGPAGPEATIAAALDWRRVGGSEECGGPMVAAVTVPAP